MSFKFTRAAPQTQLQQAYQTRASNRSNKDTTTGPTVWWRRSLVRGLLAKIIGILIVTVLYVEMLTRFESVAMADSNEPAGLLILEDDFHCNFVYILINIFRGTSFGVDSRV